MQIHSQSAFAAASESWVVDDDGKKTSGLYFVFDNLMALDLADVNTFKTVEITDMLYRMVSFPLKTHFTSLYLIVKDPYTNAVMIGAEIRQEVVLMNTANSNSGKSGLSNFF